MLLYLEASQPNGTTYRLRLGCLLHLHVASMVIMLFRLF